MNQRDQKWTWLVQKQLEVLVNRDSNFDNISFCIRITKCTFHKYGPSGTIERHDAMCVLALNIINEKIYVMLWFWLIVLAVITGFYLVMSCKL